MNGVTSHSVPGALSPDERWYQAVGKGVSQAMLSSVTHPPKFVEELTKREELEKCFAKDGKFLDQGSVIVRKVRLDSVTNRDTAAAFRRVALMASEFFRRLSLGAGITTLYALDFAILQCVRASSTQAALDKNTSLEQLRHEILECTAEQLRNVNMLRKLFSAPGEDVWITQKDLSTRLTVISRQFTTCTKGTHPPPTPPSPRSSVSL